MRNRVFIAIALGASLLLTFRAVSSHESDDVSRAATASGTPISFRFEGFAGSAPEWRVRAELDPRQHPGSSYQLGLVAEHDGEVLAVEDLTVEVDGTALVTDGGWVRFHPRADGAGAPDRTFSVVAGLPAGRYALVARAVDAQRALLGTPQAVWFDVEGAADRPPAPHPAGERSTTTTEAPTTTAGTAVPAVGAVQARGLRLVPLPAEHPLRGVPTGSWPALRCDSASCAGTPVTLPG